MPRGVQEHESHDLHSRPITNEPDDTAPGIEFLRHFSREGIDPFDEVEWELRSAVIANEKGEIVFEQRDVEMPKTWSQQATNIVVSKYFRGQVGTPERERSVKQLIGRVVDTMTDWARRQHYFVSDDDLHAFRALHRLDTRGGAHHDLAPAGLVGVPDPFSAHDRRARRKVRTQDTLHKLLGSRIRVPEQEIDAVA